jgi:hypothetical protein
MQNTPLPLMKWVFGAVVIAQLIVAQASLGKITGQLLDPNGGPITNANTYILAKNTTTGMEYKAELGTKSNTYEMVNLPAGTYDLSIPMACCMYRTFSQKSVTLAAGQNLRLELHLDWGINLGTVGDDPVMLNNDMRLKAKNTEGPTPRMSDGKPDLSGMWVPVADPRPAPQFALKPWAAELQKKLLENSSYRQGPAAYCLPQSAVQITLPFPYKLIQTPTLLIHITEFLTPGYRQIFMDGRGHPKDWNPAWMGHSIGKWEGDTLVIETTGYNEMAAGAGVHTENLKLIERITRPDKGHLDIDPYPDA